MRIIKLVGISSLLVFVVGCSLAFAGVSYQKINDNLFKSIDNGVETTYDINVIKAERENKDIMVERAMELDNLIAEHSKLNIPVEVITPPPEPTPEPTE